MSSFTHGMNRQLSVLIVFSKILNIKPIKYLQKYDTEFSFSKKKDSLVKGLKIVTNILAAINRFTNLFQSYLMWL